MANKPFVGMLEMIGDKKFGFVRDFRQDIPKGDDDAFVPPPLIRRFKLRDGVVMEGTLRPGRKGALQVDRLHKVMGLHPNEWAKTRKFESGQIIYPDEKLQLVRQQNDYSMRVVDLACPIGKGLSK